jgi:hypothetical protein
MMLIGSAWEKPAPAQRIEIGRFSPVKTGENAYFGYQRSDFPRWFPYNRAERITLIGKAVSG